MGRSRDTDGGSSKDHHHHQQQQDRAQILTGDTSSAFKSMAANTIRGGGTRVG